MSQDKTTPHEQDERFKDPAFAVAKAAAEREIGLYREVMGANQHPDDAAVDAFAASMKEKLAAARAKGRGGWQDCPPNDLSRMLREHVEKGDPRDVANFAMFLWHLGAPIAAHLKRTGQSVTNDALRCRVGNCMFNGEVPQHIPGCPSAATPPEAATAEAAGKAPASAPSDAGPQPMTEAPPVGTICWTPFYEFNNSFVWAGIPGSFQEQWLKEGKVFHTEADALSVCRAALAAQPRSTT